MREQRQRLWQQWRRLEKRIRAKDELYDVQMLRDYHCKNDGYGELLPSFSKQLAEVLNITATNKIMDVGSGIGFLCFDLACLTGCTVRGIEIRREIYLKSMQIAKHVCDRMKLDVSFLYGDGTDDTISFLNQDLIICCNTLWSGENNYRLLQKLCLQMRPGTRVVVLEQLGGQRHHSRSPRQQGDILSACFQLPPQKHTSEPGSVSWTDKPIHFYVYTKKKIARDVKDQIERDRGNVLKTPKHRTDPHVAEAGLHRAKRVMDVVEGLEDELEQPAKRQRSQKSDEDEEDDDEDDEEELDTDADVDADADADDDVIVVKVKPAKPAIPARIVSKRPPVKSVVRGGSGSVRRKVAAAGVKRVRISSRMPSADAVLPQTRSQARALRNNPSSKTEVPNPKARLRSASSPPNTPPTTTTTTSTTQTNTDSNSENTTAKSSRRNFGTTSRQRGASQPEPKVEQKVSERKSLRVIKFNMKLNDFIA